MDTGLTPQKAKEEEIKRQFAANKKLLGQLFPKDGETILARAVNGAVMASRAEGKEGSLSLANIPAEDIVEKCIAALHMGLEPGSECYLIPYGGKLTLQIGPQGLVKLMMQSGFVKDVVARSVRAGDVFDYDLGDEGFIRHKKSAESRLDGAVTYGYAYLRTTTGGIIRDVLTRDEIDFYRALSKMPEGGPMWKNFFDGAVRKTMLHRIAEFVPRSAVLSAALRQTEQDAGVVVSDEIRDLLRQMNAAPVEPVVMSASAGGAVPEAGAS